MKLSIEQLKLYSILIPYSILYLFYIPLCICFYSHFQILLIHVNILFSLSISTACNSTIHCNLKTEIKKKEVFFFSFPHLIEKEYEWNDYHSIYVIYWFFYGSGSGGSGGCGVIEALAMSFKVYGSNGFEFITSA